MCVGVHSTTATGLYCPTVNYMYFIVAVIDNTRSIRILGHHRSVVNFTSSIHVSKFSYFNQAKILPQRWNVQQFSYKLVCCCFFYLLLIRVYEFYRMLVNCNKNNFVISARHLT